MNRFFLDPADMDGDRVCLAKAQAHQICHVLRLAVDDRIVVLDNQGWEYEVALTAVGRSQVTGRVIERRPVRGETAIPLTLFQSLLARDKFEIVLQKCTEVGVQQFVPVLTERSLVRNGHAFDEGRVDRWTRIMAEAAEQSERGHIPRLQPPARFDQALTLPGQDEVRLLACPRPCQQSLQGALALAARPKAVALLVGPEAGFSDRETELARAAGWIPFNLGSRVLRTETAAIVASALVLYELRQMEPQG